MDLDDLSLTPILIGLGSIVAIGGIAHGQMSGKFAKSSAQNQIESVTEQAQLAERLAVQAKARYEAGCHPLLYLNDRNEAMALPKGFPVLSSAYWERAKNKKVKPLPNLTDYLTEGTVVCDVYGNSGVLQAAEEPGKPAIVASLASTPDREVVRAWLSKFQTQHGMTIHQPKLGAN